MPELAAPEELRPARFWQRRYGFVIVDPDGWRGSDGRSPADAITYEEFARRAGASTVAPFGTPGSTRPAAGFELEERAEVLDSEPAPPWPRLAEIVLGPGDLLVLQTEAPLEQQVDEIRARLAPALAGRVLVVAPSVDVRVIRAGGLAGEPELAADGPHSRACGWRRHPHGVDCSTNCPTCAGRPAGSSLAGQPGQAGGHSGAAPSVVEP